MDNIKTFNIVAGKLLADLYEHFPVVIEVDFSGWDVELVPIDDYDAAFDMNSFVEATVKWLDRAGYIWLEEPSDLDSNHMAVLSPKGLEVLKAIPESVEGKASLGGKLVEFAKQGASDALSKAVELAITTGFKIITNSVT